MHLPDSELRLFVQNQLPAEEARQMREHLNECPDCAARLKAMATLEALAAREHTSQTKQEWTSGELAAQLNVLGPTGFRTEGRVLERSRDVLRLLLFHELVRHTLAQIRTPHETLLGEVRHCRRVAGNQFEVTLRVQAITRLLPDPE
jgi:Putative zinc-finger